MPQLQSLSFVVLPEHVKDPLALHEIFAFSLHENLLHSPHPSDLIILHGPLLLFHILFLLCRCFLEVVEETIFARNHFFFSRDLHPVQHDESKILNILKTFLGKIFKELGHIVAGTPYEYNAIADQLFTQFESLLN